MGRVSPQALNENEWVKIFLPPLCLTKDWVPTCGEKKVYHPTRPPPGGLRFLSETASLQEAGRALAIGPHPSILLPKQWRLFLFVLRITLVETNSFRLMKILPQSSHSFPVDPSYPFSLNEPSSPIREWGIEILQSTSHFWCPVWRFCCVFRKEKGEGQGQKSDNYQFEFRMNQISPSRIRTYDQSVNSRPLYHWATEEERT